jgi:osmoprotectant transport system permease protein
MAQDRKILYSQYAFNFIYLLAFVFYISLISLLLLSELGVLEWLRATNQVLILISLLFIPFLLFALSGLIRSLKLRLPGQEIEIEIFQRVEDVQLKVNDIDNKVASEISTAEESLWPILGTTDLSAIERWKQKRLIIGSKKDLSQIFFAHFLAEWLEGRIEGITCELRVPNGGSLKNFADLKYQWIDLYIDFTGTLCQFFNVNHQGKSPESLAVVVNRQLESIGMKMFPSLGASEDYCLVIDSASAEKYGIKTLRDLQWIAHELVFVGDPEFLNRKDCYLGIVERYNARFKRTEICSITERYRLLEEGQADVVVGYRTDPQLQTDNVLVLEDSDNFLPPYQAVPVTSLGAVENIVGLEQALRALENVMTTNDLVSSILQLKYRGTDPAIARSIARDFCHKIGSSNIH